MVSKQKILFANSSGFPENMPGILITDNTYYTKGYGRQFYIVYNSTRIYIRYQLEADGTWSSWENMTNTIMNNGNVPLADLIATYPQNKVSYNLITSSYALSEGYPNNEAGTLITHSIKPKETGWQYQTYTTYTTNVVYYRFVNPNGTWSIWSKLLFNNPIPPSYSNIATSTISANSSYLTNITVTGTKVEDSAICNPANDLPDGLIMTCICRVDKIIIKISNVTSSPITFTGMPVNYRIFPRTWK
jgi:hypothetical protein